MNSSISVAVRIRPFTPDESQSLQPRPSPNIFLSNGSFSDKPQVHLPKGLRCILKAVDDRMLIFDPPETNPLTSMARNAFPNQNSRIREHRFVFDRVFSQDALQEDVYAATTRPLIDNILEGFNATVFAYGATGCGKTHTISGTSEDPGIIFLTMRELYERIEQCSDEKIVDVSLSYLEIYNETIRDLLSPSTDCKRLVLREDANNKISVSNLSTHKPTSVEEVMQMILVGNSNRTSSPTEANATSSRSHAVLQINIVQKDRTSALSENHTYATLSIIDLAGSERAAATKNRGARLNEGANINRSLLALGNCINALCDPRRRNHVPYRDSKLTRLLKFSLGGNCKTVMVVCVSPSSKHYDETLNTLKYADRAKEIKTKLVRNTQNLDRHVGSYLKMITQQKAEIEELRKREKTIVQKELSNASSRVKKNLACVFEAVEGMSNSLSGKLSDLWNKYFVLSKRKLLMLQRIDVETLREKKHSQTISALLDQLLHKLDLQIIELEAQYATKSDIDHIFESSPQVIHRLCQNDGWSDDYTAVFVQQVEHLSTEFERNVLFQSSILFDHLVHELKDYSLVQAISTNSLEATLDALVNGEYDTAVERCTTEFMREKLAEGEHMDKPTKREGAELVSSPPSKKAKDRKSRKEDVSMLESDVSMDNGDDDRKSIEGDILPKDLLEQSMASPGPAKNSLDLTPQSEIPDYSLPSSPTEPTFETPRAKYSNPRLSHQLKRETSIPLLNKRASAKMPKLPNGSFSPAPSAHFGSHTSHVEFSPASIMEKYSVDGMQGKSLSRADSVE